MADHTTRDELRDDLHEAVGYAKDAVRASLLAVRSALDFALSKLDDDAPERGAPTRDREESEPSDDAPAPPSG